MDCDITSLQIKNIDGLGTIKYYIYDIHMVMIWMPCILSYSIIRCSIISLMMFYVMLIFDEIKINHIMIW